MRVRAPFVPPPEVAADIRRRARLEWTTIGFMLSIITVLYFTTGSSQAMKTAWVEDILSLIPPIAILVADRIGSRPPSAEYPYGYYRAVTIAFLAAAVALTAFGLLLLFEAVTTLLMMEQPAVGTTVLFGHTVWMGWPMIAALTYSVIPPVVLGRMKTRLAVRLHDKALHADAEMNRADWLTGLAAIGGILGMGMGWWWADAAAAGLISLDIVRDGWTNLRRVTADLMDQMPTGVGTEDPDPLVSALRERIESLGWFEVVEVRLREEGMLLSGEVFVLPCVSDELTQRMEAAEEAGRALHWRLHDVVLVPRSAKPPLPRAEGLTQLGS